MLDHIDWEVVNSFSGWASALATFLAVVAALYLSRRDNMIRLSVRASLRTQWVEGGGPGHGDQFVSINVINRGRRAATVDGLYWRTGLLRRRRYLDLGSYSTPIPTRLEDGVEVGYLVPAETFLNNFDDIASRLLRRRLAKLWLRTLRVVVTTTAGKRCAAQATRELREKIFQRHGRDRHVPGEIGSEGQ